MTTSTGRRHGPTGGGLTRRRFISAAAAAGGLAALGPVPPTWGQPGKASTGQGRPRERHTLFFNLAHEPGVATSSYYLIVAGREYRLGPVSESPQLLTRARQTNRFLQGVPDHQLTHVVADVSLPGDAVQVCYVKADPDLVSGTWKMSSMFVHLPQVGLRGAHARGRPRGRGRLTAGPLPHSAKRRLYGHPPAKSLDDCLEEQALKDFTDHAAALISFHPDLASLEPVSAAHIHTNHIHTNGETLGLAFALQQAGPAAPQVTANLPNASGWATMEPLTDESGASIRATHGSNAGLIQYLPAWNDSPPLQIETQVGIAIAAICPGVKDDESLGADITGLDPGTSPKAIPGTIWARHDGVTTVDQSPGAANPPISGLFRWTLLDVSTDKGMWIRDNWSVTTDPTSGNPLLTVSFVNWHPRHLGIWVQFLDANQNPLDLAGLGFAFVDHGDDTTQAKARQTFNTKTVAYGMLVGSSFQLFGVPVVPVVASLSVTIPPKVTSVKILAVGLGVLGNNDYPDLVSPGGWMTGLVNYAAPTIAMAVGISTWQSVLKPFVAPILSALAVECVVLLAFNANDDPEGILKAMIIPLMRVLLGVVQSISLKALAVYLAAQIGAAEVEDSIPLVGQILRAAAAVSGAAALLATTIDCLAVPHYYSWQFTQTHDLSVTLEHDPTNTTFPVVANYYKVTALFDGGGTPHTQTLDTTGGVLSMNPVVFRDVPRGGQVSISVGFYSRSTDLTKNDWLAGQGETGLVDNTVDQHVLQITENKVPIRSHTVYQHERKTRLVNQGGEARHVWTPTSVPPSTIEADIACEGPGSLCDFRGITIRQGTSERPGYVGYAWKGDSLGVTGCAGGQGQFDIMANLGTDDPQSGYVTGPCGFPDGVQIAYSLLDNRAANFYFDSAARVVRSVVLDPTPEFAPRTEKLAWGQFNLESTALLLHPNGKLVSINNANHRIEVLKLPPAAVADDDARVHLLAEVHSGQGSRPGLLQGPSAAAISPDGVVLILEAQHRIQAFDTGGGPVPFFKKQPTPYWLSLTATSPPADTQYVDLAVEFTGYLYVLSYDRGTLQYRMDVYHPGQSGTAPISTTRGVNAAKLAVDFWRNMYTLNYEVLQVPAGVQALTEPSVSRWTPSPP